MVSKIKWDFRMKGELVRFKTEDGMLLHGFLVNGGTGKIFIHIHGMGSNFYDEFRLPFMAEEMIKCGYSFLTINTRGHDTIADISTTKSVWASKYGTTFEKFEDSIYDIKAAIDFVSKNGFSEIVLSGHSTGCQKIAYYQIKIQDKRVKGIVLLSPADDYNVAKKEFGEKLEEIVKEAKKLDENDLLPTKMINGAFFGADRFLSVADPKRTESQIFNYNSEMKIFSKIKCPILAIFGSEEQYATKPVKEHLEILKRYTGSSKFDSAIIKGADHNFTKKENELAEKIGKWLVSL